MVPSDYDIVAVPKGHYSNIPTGSPQKIGRVMSLANIMQPADVGERGEFPMKFKLKLP